MLETFQKGITDLNKVLKMPYSGRHQDHNLIDLSKQKWAIWSC